jgi:hypothetical protein
VTAADDDDHQGLLLLAAGGFSLAYTMPSAVYVYRCTGSKNTHTRQTEQTKEDR